MKTKQTLNRAAVLSALAFASILIPSLAQAGGRPTTGPIRIIAIDDRGSSPIVGPPIVGINAPKTPARNVAAPAAGVAK